MQNEGLLLSSNPALSDSKLCPFIPSTHNPGVKQYISSKEIYNQVGKIYWHKNITLSRNGVDSGEISEERQRWF